MNWLVQLHSTQPVAHVVGVLALSVGLEALYGLMEARNGVDSGDHWRARFGMVYSLVD